MAGGTGTRLRPLTCDLPKPMVPIVNRPVMEYTIELLKKHGIQDIAVTLGYLPGVIREHFGTGAEYGVNLQYFVEETPLGTAGSVMNTGDFLQETYIVISGDALTDLDIGRALAFHRERGSQATLVLKTKPIPLEYGVVMTDEGGRITRFLEKPSWGEVFSDTVNTGIYILEPGIMGEFKKGETFDFSKDLFPKLLQDDSPMYGFVTDDYWCDIGDLASYRQAQFDLLDGKVNARINAVEKQPGIWIGAGCSLTDNVRLEAPAYIGKGSLAKDVQIGPYTVINDNCHILGGSLKRTVVWKQSNLGRDVEGRGATICRKVTLDAGVRMFEDTVVGDYSILESGVTIQAGVKVWPGKTILEDTVLKQNLVWGSGASRRLFGRKDISGTYNGVVSPEFASRLGSAFAALAGQKGSYVVSADNTEAGALVADALGAGLLACGAGVMRASGLAAPMTRFAVGHYKALGGIHVRIEPDGILVRLEFMGPGGANIDRNEERKLEAVFNNDDYKRVSAGETQIVQRSGEIPRLYFAEGARNLHYLGPGKSGPGVVLGGETDHLAFLASSYLAFIGCRVRHGESAAAVRSGVLEHGADLGFFLGCDGGLAVIDEKGTVVGSEEYRALAALIALETGGGSLVIPHDAPQAIGDMVNAKAEIVRVKSGLNETMAQMMDLGETDPGVALQYLLCFDGLLAPGRIADYLAGTNLKLSQVLKDLPVLHFKKQTVPCQWSEKGRVLRELVVEYKESPVELYEGVKIFDQKGWALVLPDEEKPVFNIYAQGHTEEFAQELSVEFSAKVNSLLKREGKH